MTVKLNLSGHANAHLDAMGFINPGTLHVDLNDDQLVDKLIQFLKPLVGDHDQVVVALPGLAPLAALIVTILHGLTGNFPIIQPLVRSDNGFVPSNPIDLNAVRQQARCARTNTVVL